MCVCTPCVRYDGKGMGCTQCGVAGSNSLAAPATKLVADEFERVVMAGVAPVWLFHQSSICRRVHAAVESGQE